MTSSVLISSFANLASSMIVNLIPGSALSLPVSMFVKDLITSTATFNAFRWFNNINICKKQVCVSIPQKKRSHNNFALNNLMYEKMDIYLLNKCRNTINNCDAYVENNEIMLKLGVSNKQYDSYYVDDYNSKTYYITHTIIVSNDSNTVSSNFTVECSSKQLNDIYDYLTFIYKQPIVSSMTTIYQIHIEGNYPFWAEVRIKTYRTFENTIVSQTTKKLFLDDVNKFINNKEHYHNNGLSYKRGYLLYGPPGTGKTSIIKAIAKTYNLPIYVLDINLIGNNANLYKIIQGIHNRQQNSPYILCIEDIERCKFFTDTQNNTDPFNQSITPDGFLNMMDGLVDNYGQIIMVTTNNLDKIKNFYIDGINFSEALLRPGRIDKFIEITYIDQDQLNQICQQFYHQDAPLIINDNIKITQACVYNYITISKNINEFIQAIQKDDNDKNNKPKVTRQGKNTISKSKTRKIK